MSDEGISAYDFLVEELRLPLVVAGQNKEAYVRYITDRCFSNRLTEPVLKKKMLIRGGEFEEVEDDIYSLAREIAAAESKFYSALANANVILEGKLRDWIERSEEASKKRKREESKE